MKKQLRILTLAILATCITGRLLAQDSLTTLPAITITTVSKVNQQVNTAFHKYFKDAIEPQWYRVNKDYMVKFIKNDMNNHALFTKGGSLVYHISYGTEQQLPDAIRKDLRTTYPDYSITRAVNVKEGGRDIWVVNLESPTKLVLARSENGELEEVGNYIKSL